MSLLSQLQGCIRAIILTPIIFGFIIFCSLVVLTGSGDTVLSVIDALNGAAKVTKRNTDHPERQPSPRVNPKCPSGRVKRARRRPGPPPARRAACPIPSARNSPLSMGEHELDSDTEDLLQSDSRSDMPKLDTFMFGENRHPVFNFTPLPPPIYHGAYGLQELAVPKPPKQDMTAEEDIIEHGLEELNFA
ncbi:hypothetical protein FE257_004715 [Aspergillus nanangensis]|uniref:Uncharacterized protein n=1 Tax=Aspergillus nanangensis TaxID=2582783 RepID=A0AAD4CZ02_ASPNN|nr:hypothetical protein FE257_004715 [Aspergillus nanangensis]